MQQQQPQLKMARRLALAGCCLYLLQVALAQDPCCESYCYITDNDRTQAKHFATKTIYELTRASDSDRQHIVPECRPVKFWLLSRHGTRLPGRKDIELLPKNLNELREAVLDNYYSRRTAPDKGRMCDDDLEMLRHWRWDQNITENYDSYLTTQGWNDLKYLAIRYKDKFFDIFSGPYRPQQYLFRHTKTQRTEASFRAFVEGLFGGETSATVKPAPEPDNDTLLKPYDFCPAYDANKQANKDPHSEPGKFLRSELFLSTLSDISRRLGFKYNLSVEQVEYMWDACRYELSWNLKPSPWCAVFTKEQVNVFEYKEDLSYYYTSSYGYSGSADLACYAIADMMKHLGSTEDPLTVAYFTHDAEIQLFLAALGAKKDSMALRADNYHFMRNRNYRSSEIPFAANVAAVKYQCTDPREPVKVIFFQNEKVLFFDWCDVGLCNWSSVVRQFQRHTTGDCANLYCGGSAASQMQVSIVILVTAVLLLLSSSTR